MGSDSRAVFSAELQQQPFGGGHKKRVYEHDTGAGEYQDILDTLKADY